MLLRRVINSSRSRLSYPKPYRLAAKNFRMASTLILSDSRTLNYALDVAPKDGPLVVLSNSLCAPFNVWDHVVKILNTKFPNTVSKLVICDTISSSPVNAGVEDLFGPRVAAAREAGNLDVAIQSTLESWFGKDWLESNPEETQRIRTIMKGTTLDGFETCCNALRSKNFDLRPLFSKVGASVDDAICIVGEKGANLPQAMDGMRNEIEEGFKAAGKDNMIELVIIKDAGHVCFVDGLQQFQSTILSFLKR